MREFGVGSEFCWVFLAMDCKISIDGFLYIT